jgi:hypothetical protein
MTKYIALWCKLRMKALFYTTVREDGIESRLYLAGGVKSLPDDEVDSQSKELVDYAQGMRMKVVFTLPEE